MKKSLAMATLGLVASCISLPVRAEEGPYVAGRFALTPSYYKFNLTPRIVPVHQDDAGFLSGSTQVRENDGLALTLRGGLEAGYKFGALSLHAGADLELNTLRWTERNRDSPGYNIVPQENDSRGYWGSCVFVKTSPQALSVIPFVGTRLRLTESILLGLEAGLINTEIERTSGHHRYNQEQAIESENLDAEALRITIRLLFGEDNEKGKVGLEVSKAKYNLTGRNGSEGTIDETSVGLFVVKKF